MAQLDIAETAPAAGRTHQLRVRGAEIDLRVSTMPTIHGESVVLRMLDRRRSRSTLQQARLRAANAAHSPAARPAERHRPRHRTDRQRQDDDALHRAARLNRTERKIFTVEDPIEYQLDGINQIQVNPRIDMTFAKALRAILRQDPDIIMIGEIRDLETARDRDPGRADRPPGAVDAAHQRRRRRDHPPARHGGRAVHVNATILGVMAQRLVRTLCMSCAAPGPATAQWERKLAGNLPLRQRTGAAAFAGR